MSNRRPTDKEAKLEKRVAELAQDLARLEVLCYRLLPDLQAARLLPGESPHRRLKYMLELITPGELRLWLYGDEHTRPLSRRTPSGATD